MNGKATLPSPDSPDPGDRSVATPTRHPTFAEAFRFWLKLGFISFGGPAGQIAIMQTELVEKRRWIGQARFLHALNFCMLLPGPEAQQLAIYIGWLLHRTWGGIVAGALFVLPSMFILWGLSFAYAAYGNVPWIAAIFYGLKPAVMAIVAVAVIRIGRKALKNPIMWGIAAAAFIGIFFLRLPFPLIVLSALVGGFIGGHFWRSKFVVLAPHGEKSSATSSVLSDEGGAAEHMRPSWRRAVRIAVICLALWWLPILLVGAWQGWDSTLFKEGLFFSKAAVVTFGGAYAVLPYVAQQALDNYGWLETGQMMDGLGLAETTPGPLIMVLQFVGFMGGWNQPGALTPLAAATLGALLTTWVTFLPCFLWILLGAPHLEQLRGNQRLTAALSAVTAAVVGVVLNLAVWFGMHAVFPPDRAVDWFAVVLSVIAFVGMLRWKWDVVPVIIVSGLAGLLFRLLF
ncbi:chromate efflux transporter [soil metagenome]|nr:chromate efflux transporter [Chthoniobacterales bacterium]